MKKSSTPQALISEITILRKRILLLERSAAKANRLIDSLQSYIQQNTYLHEIQNQQIANQLHENILQNLAAISLSIESIIRALHQKPDTISSQLIDLQQRINTAIRDVRHFSHQIRSEVLDCLGLVESLESLADEMRSQYQININLTTRGAERTTSANIKTGLYHIAREALKNTCQHSQASHARMILGFNSRTIKLRIRDNGSGFKIPEKFMYLANSGKTGLINIENWTLIMNGKVRITSEPDQGTEITVEVPT